MPATGTNTTVNVNYNHGFSSINQQNAIDLNEGDMLTIQLVGFPAGSSIDTVEFWHNKDENLSRETGIPFPMRPIPSSHASS